MSATLLIGIDCATKANKTGLAFGCLVDGKLTVHSAKRGTGEEWESGVDGKVEEWIAKGKRQARKVLLALDAPLGWPRPLGDALVPHRARPLGDALVPHRAGCAFSQPQDDSPFQRTKKRKTSDADLLFQRATDRVVHDALDIKPLDVGANLIARTAHTALCFLDRLRKETECPIPLAWEPGHASMACVSAIEVYPAATLKERGLPFEGYKKTQQAQSVRNDIIERLESKMGLENIKDEMRKNDDVLDAVVCVLAASDFVRDDVRCPADSDLELAEEEGWIWVRKA